MKNPVISIVMPVYNCIAHLGETIESVRNQTFRDFEVICVDDGSTDGSGEMLRQLVAEDPRFSVIRKENAGAGAARNFGLTHAKGEYVIFLDSDDLFSGVLLEKLHGVIVKHQADVAACNFSRFYPDGTETQHEGVRIKWIPQGLEVFSYRDCPDYIMRVINPTPWNKLYRTAFIREHGFAFDEISSTNDIAFASVSVAAAERVTFVPDSLVRYRVGHGGTISGTKPEKLNNVTYAIDSAVSQASRLPHSGVIKNAIQSFVVDNYITALSRYIQDFSDPKAAEFYQRVHLRFNDPALADVTSKTLNNPKQFRQFCTVRKHDYQTMKLLKSRRLVVSLTTYPKRIHLIPRVLYPVYRQRQKPDEVVLWLAGEQFPGKEKDLPAEVLALAEEGKLTIRWCEDLKPHKKYFYALQEYADDLVVTIDDDLWVTWNTLETLYESYLLYPEAVSTTRAHLIMLDEEKRILPYKSWIQETDACIYEPSMQLFATGGAGVLYPPLPFRKEFFDIQTIQEICPIADDLWLKAMQLASDVPVVVARPHEQLQYLAGSQDEALKELNVAQNQNDVQLQQIIRWMDEKYGEGFFLRKLIDTDCGSRILGISAVSQHLDAERKATRKKLSLAEGKSKQLETRLKQTETQKADEASKRKTAEEALKQTKAELQQTHKTLQQTQDQLKRTQDAKQRTETQLAKTTQQLADERARLQQTRGTLQQTQGTLQQTQGKLQQTQGQLERTRLQLRQTEESKPIGRQLKAVGKFLRERKSGSNPVLWGFKYGLYLLAWVPEKLLAGMMFYLHNGGKQTVKHIMSRFFRKK